MRQFAALPTSPSPALSRRGPSLSPLKGGEGLFPVNLRLRNTARVQSVSVPRTALRYAGIERGGWSHHRWVRITVQFVMQPDMVYQYPLWRVGLLLVGLAALGAVSFGLAARLFLSVELRRRHNDATAAIFSVIGVTFAVLLAFVAMLARQGLVWGLIAGGAGIGSAFSPSLFSWTISYYGWRKSFWLAGATTALLAATWAGYARDRPPDHRSTRGDEQALLPFNAKKEAGNPPRKPALRKLLANRNVMLLAAGYMTVGYFEYIFFFWIYYYFGEIRHMSRTETSVYTTVIFLAWAVMAPVGGWLSDQLVRTLGKKIGRPMVPAGGMLLGSLLLFSGMQLSRPGAVGALLALSFGLASCSDGPFWAATIDAGGEDVGAACGVLNTGSNIGGFIAPVLTPFIASLAGWSAALYFGCFVAALGVAIWLFIDATPPAVSSREGDLS